MYQSAELFTLRGLYQAVTYVAYPQLIALNDTNSFWDFGSGYDIVGFQMSTTFLEQGLLGNSPLGVALIVGRKDQRLAIGSTLPALALQVATKQTDGSTHVTASLGPGFCKKAPPGTRIGLWFFGDLSGGNFVDTIANVYAIPWT